ncbi:hypothetical protein [Metabacillus fastidiosus]|uniref:hypothetical protein n=1 Tax=Metabacillus fastidiosus TaxID=1458 RepID=UPI000825C351|nr:hypothetical protein [Metabacillus fastidiosus]MED4464486.1 hypothetical protein [Metabacillus fastidiosus]
MKKSTQSFIHAAAITAATTSAVIAGSPVEASASSNTADLVKQANQSAGLLKDYYDLTKWDKIVISKGFLNAYNKAENDIKRAEKAVSEFKGSNKNKLAAQLEIAKSNQLKAARLIDAINMEKELNIHVNRLQKYIKAETINDDMVEAYYDLADQMKKAERVFSKVYGEKNREIIRGKFLIEPKIMKESVIYEVSSYTLQNEIAQQLEEDKIQEAKENYKKLERLERRAIAIKEAGNKIHKGKYPELKGMTNILKGSKNQLQNGFVIQIDAKSTEQANPTVYGTKEITTVKKDLVITSSEGTYLELKNLNVEGDILIKTVNGSAGQVKLTNVNAKGIVKVEEAAEKPDTGAKILANPSFIQLVIGGGSKIPILNLYVGAQVSAENHAVIGNLIINTSKSNEVVSLNGELFLANVIVKGQGAEVKLGSDVSLREMILKTSAIINAANGTKLNSLLIESEQALANITLKGDLSLAHVIIGNSNPVINIAEDTVVKKIEKDPSVTEEIKIDNKGSVEEAVGIEISNNTVPPVSDGGSHTESTIGNLVLSAKDDDASDDKTVITVNGAAQSGNEFVYKVFENMTDANAGKPVLNADVSSWSLLPGNGIITALNGKVVVVIERNATDKRAKKVGETTAVTEDSTNNAAFTLAAYNGDNNILEISGLTNVEADSDFDLKKLTYSNAEVPLALHTLAGSYKLAASLSEVNSAGEYFYSSGTLKVILTDGDAVAIETLSGFGHIDALTAAKGWNNDGKFNQVKEISNIDITVTPE